MAARWYDGRGGLPGKIHENRDAIKPKIISESSAAKRYGPMPVKSVLVVQAYVVSPAVTRKVIPAAMPTAAALAKRQAQESITASHRVKPPSRM